MKKQKPAHSEDITIIP